MLATGLLAVAAALSGVAEAEPEWQNWQSDMTDSMGIGPTLKGYSRVELRCGADCMTVHVEMEDDFDGVLYARGAFHSREEPCFYDAHGGRNFSLRLPFDKCNTHEDENVFSNTIVIQYDDELIMPGDAAFKLECDYQRLKVYTVSTDLKANRDLITSKIILEDADPAPKEKLDDQITVSSDSHIVAFSPNLHSMNKRDEL